MRNVLIAVGNSRNVSLVEQTEKRLSDASPLVRAMAVWALQQLLDQEAFAALRKQHQPNEGDRDVLAEWGSV